MWCMKLSILILQQKWSCLEQYFTDMKRIQLKFYKQIFLSKNWPKYPRWWYKLMFCWRQIVVTSLKTISGKYSCKNTRKSCDDIMPLKLIPYYWPSVRVSTSQGGFPKTKGQQGGAYIFSLLMKQLNCQWFEMAWCSCNVTVMNRKEVLPVDNQCWLSLQ